MKTVEDSVHIYHTSSNTYAVRTDVWILRQSVSAIASPFVPGSKIQGISHQFTKRKVSKGKAQARRQQRTKWDLRHNIFGKKITFFFLEMRIADLKYMNEVFQPLLFHGL
jgi:hypothetical protein